MSEKPRLTPTELYLKRARKRRAMFTVGGLLALAVAAYLILGRSGPVTYRKDAEHFKYGSIGSDASNGIPVDILLALPEAFPEYLPEGAKSPKDLSAFGFIREPGHRMPIGFSYRRGLVATTGLNCAACHVGTVRTSAEEPGMNILAMPSNTVNLYALFAFLFNCANDDRFTYEHILAAMQKRGFVGPLDKALLVVAVPRLRSALLQRRGELSLLFEEGHPEFGPGRVDTFNPYKLIQFRGMYDGKVAEQERFGTSDFPSVWNQAVRENMELHWDGNNSSVDERNVSAAFGAGATPDDIDLAAVERVRDWLWELEPPKFSLGTIDEVAASRGQQIYVRYCYNCHDPKGAGVGKVVPIGNIGTSRYRFDSYTPVLAGYQRAYVRNHDGAGWTMESFKKTVGYASAPLDGLWARAPYLHNGSIPTVWELLTPAEERSQEPFFRGHGVLDLNNLGIRRDVPRANGLPSFLFDVGLPGNGNGGHSGPEYGTSLADSDKRDLIEYLKTL